MRGRALLLFLLFALTNSACATFVQKTVPGYAHDLPERMYGLGPGPITREDLRKAGWAFAEVHDGVEMYVYGGAATGVSDVEAQVAPASNDERAVQFLRMKYARTRLATYKELLNNLLTAYGPPQVSSEVPRFEYFQADPSADTPRPPSFIVHRWKGPKSQIVLAAGLEDHENLLSSMQYQLFFLPPDKAAVAATQP